MWSLLVVAADVLPQDSLKVVFAEDEDVVQTLPSYGFQETLDLSCRKTHLPPIDINRWCLGLSPTGFSISLRRSAAYRS